MRFKLPVTAAAALLLVCGATASRAEKGSARGKKSETAIPESVNRQFQWEEKVVGPKTKGVDHQKIAAMQEQARREDAARKKEPPKKQARAEGIDAPASSTLPTMDIEKPAPAGSVRRTAPAKRAEEPRRRDALDNLLAEEGSKPGPRTTAAPANRSGLGSILAVEDRPAPTPPPAAARAKPAAKKHGHKRRR
jgi:hypothetical protein